MKIKILFILQLIFIYDLHARVGIELVSVTTTHASIQCDYDIPESSNEHIQLHEVNLSDLSIGMDGNTFYWVCPVTKASVIWWRNYDSPKDKVGVYNALFYELKRRGNIHASATWILNEDETITKPFNIKPFPKGNEKLIPSNNIDPDIEFKMDLMKALGKRRAGTKKAADALTVNEIINGNNTIKNWKAKGKPTR